MTLAEFRKVSAALPPETVLLLEYDGIIVPVAAVDHIGHALVYFRTRRDVENYDCTKTVRDVLQGDPLMGDKRWCRVPKVPVKGEETAPSG